MLKSTAAPDFPDPSSDRMRADPNRPAVAADDDAEFLDALRHLFEERITFNQTLGLKVDHTSADAVQCSLRMRPDLIGHFAYGRLHGGVISAVLDATGVLAVMAAMGARHRDKSTQRRLQRFARLGTIDLRVDYLRQALGERFVAHGEVTRLGSRVATTRTLFCDSDGTMLSTGAAAYIVS